MSIRDDQDLMNLEMFIRNHGLSQKSLWAGYVMSRGYVTWTSSDPFFNFNDWEESEVDRSNIPECGFLRMEKEILYYHQDCVRAGYVLCENGKITQLLK